MPQRDWNNLHKRKPDNKYLKEMASQMVPVVKNTPANARDARYVNSTPGLGRSPREGNGNPLHYSCLENPMDRGFRQAVVRKVAESQKWLKQLSTHMYIERKNVHSFEPSVNSSGIYVFIQVKVKVS